MNKAEKISYKAFIVAADNRIDHWLKCSVCVLAWTECRSRNHACKTSAKLSAIVESTLDDWLKH